MDDRIEAILASPPLPPSFFQRPAPHVARELLGKVLLRLVGGEVLAGAIVETEAYLGGGDDPACHAANGATSRNASMFLAGGACYVYLCYGMHHCVNVVTGPVGRGEAVLIRAIAPLAGAAAMAARRGLAPLSAAPSRGAARLLTGGPGKVTAALGITLADDGRSFAEKSLRLVAGGQRIAPSAIGIGPRIGISKAKDLPLRFCLKDSPYVSR